MIINATKKCRTFTAILLVRYEGKEKYVLTVLYKVGEIQSDRLTPASWRAQIFRQRNYWLYDFKEVSLLCGMG